jgi:hypothetical protein
LEQKISQSCLLRNDNKSEFVISTRNEEKSVSPVKGSDPFKNPVEGSDPVKKDQNLFFLVPLGEEPVPIYREGPASAGGD